MGGKDILETITSFQERWSPQQIKIAVYVLDNIEKVAMYSVTHLTREIDVSQPTLTRFSQVLGFNKYQNFPYRCLWYDIWLSLFRVLFFQHDGDSGLPDEQTRG